MRKEAPPALLAELLKRKAYAGDILWEVRHISHETLNARHIRQMAWAREYDESYHPPPMNMKFSFLSRFFSIRPSVVCQWIADLRDSHRITKHHYPPLIGQKLSTQSSDWLMLLSYGEGVATVHKKLSGDQYCRHHSWSSGPWLLIMSASQNAKYPGCPVYTTPVSIHCGQLRNIRLVPRAQRVSIFIFTHPECWESVISDVSKSVSRERRNSLSFSSWRGAVNLLTRITHSS